MKICLILVLAVYFVIVVAIIISMTVLSTKCENHYQKLETYNEIKAIAESITNNDSYNYNSLMEDDKQLIDEYEYLTGLYVIRRNIAMNNMLNKSIIHENLSRYCSSSHIHMPAESALHAYINEHLIEKHGMIREI